MSSVLIHLLLLAACQTTSSENTPETESAPVPINTQPSLLIVTMDTTRVDRLGAYGYELAVTPHIDRVAEQGIRFEQAYAVVPLTTPSHASMMSGLYPTRHGIHTNGDATLDEEVTTLAEILHGDGYHTVAGVSAFVTTRIWNLDQGFKEYYDEVSASAGDRDQRWSRERSAGEVVDDLEQSLAAMPDNKPFFAWAHFYDPHDPYEPPAPYNAGEFANRPYDGEISYMDEQIGRLIALAEATAGDPGLAIILVADHGEALGEHGEMTHGMYIYEPTMHIPFIARPPKPLASTVAVTGSVSNVDVMPTALGLLSKPVPEGLDGTDLSITVDGSTLVRGPVFLESETPYTRFGFHPEWAAVDGAWKLFATPNPKLFNVHEDYAETIDRLLQQPDEVDSLDAFVDAVQATRTDNDNFNASPEVISQLAALGYVATADEGPMDLADALDAKDQSELIERIDRLQRMARMPSSFKEVEQEYREVLKELPYLGEARLSLSRVLESQGRLQDAEDILGEGVEFQPNSTVLRAGLAANLAKQNRLDEAYEISRLIHEQVPGDDLSRYAMLRYLRQMDRIEEALRKGRTWLGLEPDNNGLQALVGELEARHGDPVQGEMLLRRSLEDNVPRQNVHRTLAMYAMTINDLDSVAAHLEAEIAWFPGNPVLRLELGNCYLRAERWDDAAAEFDVMRRMIPEDPVPHRLYVQAIFSSGDFTAAEAGIQEVLARFPDDPDVVLMLANILSASGQMDAGESAFQEASALREAQRQAMEQELGVPVIEEISDDALNLPGSN